MTNKFLYVEFALIAIASLYASPALAQVAVTVGVQEIYDDNVFLENDKERPAPFVLNDELETDFQDGNLSVVAPDELDGKPNDDLITQLSLSASGKLSQFEKYLKTEAEGKVGIIIFAKNNEETRATFDAILQTESADTWIPKPFFVGARAELSSKTDDISAAQGTAARAAETLTVSGNTGIRDYEFAKNTLFDLFYTGTYHAFLGAARFSDSGDVIQEDRGSDFQSHTASTGVENEVTKGLRLGLEGNAGVQLFTNVETNDADSEKSEESLDRTNTNIQATAKYDASDKLKLNTAVGLSISKLQDNPAPREVTVIQEDGTASTVLITSDEQQEALTFLADANYTFSPGTAARVGVNQSLGTDIDGDRILTRSVFVNGLYEFNDRFSVTGGYTYVQFSPTDTISSNAFDRSEFSASLRYALSQYTALTLGYNYATQNGDDTALEERLRFTSADYDTNRVFLGISSGLVGVGL